MKTLAVMPVGILLAAMSLPALAGPNWDVIHEAEAHHLARHAPEHVLPLDHGPRAITTPWLNKVYEGEARVAASAARPASGPRMAGRGAARRGVVHG